MRAYYPGAYNQPGVDYSYGLGVPLSAGGWKWTPGTGRVGDDLPRRFSDHERFSPSRVLAIDATWSSVYNLSGNYLATGIWNDPVWYDNTVAYRHSDTSANALMQDGHVMRLSYRFATAEPINTSKTFVWYPGEPIGVGPDSRYESNLYPDIPPPRYDSNPPGSVFPDQLLPAYYTLRRAWTMIPHK